MNKKTFVIIDGNAIVHRAYHALPPLTAKDGTMVNAVYGFTSMLLKVLTDLKPDYMAVSFDVAGGTFRDTLYTAYKATRVKADQELYDQIPLCHQVVEAFGIPIFEKKGFEADDVIGTVTEKIKRLKDYKNAGGDSFGGVLGDVVQALIGLGYSAEEAREVVKDLKTEGKDAGKLVKEALRRLGK